MGFNDNPFNVTCNPAEQSCVDLAPAEGQTMPESTRSVDVDTGPTQGANNQDQNGALSQDGKGLKAIDGGAQPAPISKVLAPEAPMRKKSEEEVLIEDLRKIASYRLAFEKGGFSFEGLQGAKRKVEDVLGRELTEEEWPSKSSTESKKAILETFAEAENLLRSKIINALGKLVRPEDLYRNNTNATALDEDGDVISFYKNRKVSDLTPLVVSYNGKQINYTEELGKLLNTKDPFEFIKTAGEVSNYARVVSLRAGLETVTEMLDVFANQAEDFYVYGNILDNFTDANCITDVNPVARGYGSGPDSPDCMNARKMNKENPNYTSYDAANLKKLIKDFQSQIEEAKLLLMQGDIEGASKILIEIANSDKFKTQIPDALGTVASRKLTEKLQVSVMIVIVSGLLAKAAAAYCTPWLVEAVGAVRGAHAIISTAQLGIESGVFFVSHKAGAGLLTEDQIYDRDISFWQNMGDYGKEFLFTAGMFKVLGSIGSVYKGLVLDKIPKNATFLKALAQVGGFVAEVGGFQSWDYIRNTIDNVVFGADLDSESAFAAQNCLEGVKFLLALRIGHFLAKPVVDPINERVFKEVTAKFGARLAKLQHGLNGVLQEIQDAREGKKTRPADLVLKDAVSLLSERLTLLKEVAKFTGNSGAKDPKLEEAITETEAELSMAREVKKAVDEKVKEAERVAERAAIKEKMEKGEPLPFGIGMDPATGIAYLHGGLGGFVGIFDAVAKGIGAGIDMATAKLKGPDYKGRLEVQSDDSGKITTEVDPTPKPLFYTERYLIKQDGVTVAEVRKIHGPRNDEFKLKLTPEGKKLGVVILRDGKEISSWRGLKEGDLIKVGDAATIGFNVEMVEAEAVTKAPRDIPIEVGVYNFSLNGPPELVGGGVEGRSSSTATGTLFEGGGVRVVRSENGKMVVKTDKGVEVAVMRNGQEVKKGLLKDLEVRPGDVVVILDKGGNRYTLSIGTENADISAYGTTDTSDVWKNNVGAVYNASQKSGERFVIDQGTGSLMPLEEARQTGAPIDGPKIELVFDDSGRVSQVRVDGKPLSLIDSTRLSDNARRALEALIGLDSTVPLEWHLREVSQKTPNSFDVDGRQTHWPAGEPLKIGTNGDVKIDGANVSAEHVIITPEGDGSYILTPNGQNGFELWHDIKGEGFRWLTVDQKGVYFYGSGENEVRGESNRIKLEPGKSYRVKIGDKEIEITVPQDPGERLNVNTKPGPIKVSDAKQDAPQTSPQFAAIKGKIEIPLSAEEVVVGRASSGEAGVEEGCFALREDGNKVKVVIANSDNNIVSRKELVLKKHGDKWLILHSDNNARGKTFLICRNLTTGKRYIVEGNKEGLIESGEYSIEVVDRATTSRITGSILQKYQLRYLQELGIDPSKKENEEKVADALKDNFDTIEKIAAKYPEVKQEFYKRLVDAAKTSVGNRFTINLPSEAERVAKKEEITQKITTYLGEAHVRFYIGNLHRGGMEKLGELKEMIAEFKKMNPSEDELARLSDILFEAGLKPEDFDLVTTDAAKARIEANQLQDALHSLERAIYPRDADLATVMSRGSDTDIERAATAVVKKGSYDRFSPELLHALGKKTGNADILFNAMLRLPDAVVLKSLEEIKTTRPDIYSAIEGRWSQEVTKKADELEESAGHTIQTVISQDPESHYARVEKRYTKIKNLIDIAEKAGFKITGESKEAYENAVEVCRVNGLTFNPDGTIQVGVPEIFGTYQTPRLKTLKAIVDHFFTRKNGNGNGNGKKGNGEAGTTHNTVTLATVATDILAAEKYGAKGQGFYKQYNGEGTLALTAEKEGVRLDKEHDVELPSAIDGVFNANIHGFQGYIPNGSNLMYERCDGRFYITIDPSNYAQNVGAVVDALQPLLVKGPAAGKFVFKVMPVSRKDGSIPRRDQIVVYFKKDAGPEVRTAVEAAMSKAEKGNPKIFSEKGPYFTMKIRRGLFFGEEPPTEGQSFGTGRAGALDTADREIARLEAAGVTVDPDLRAQIVAYYFERSGFDPEHPAFNIGGRATRGEEYGFLYGTGSRPVTSQIRVADVVKPGDKSPRIQVEFQEETVWPEGKDKLVIGRDSKTADIHVPDDTAEPGISRKQAELAREDDGTISLHHYGTNPTKVRKFKSDDGYVGEVVLEKGKSPESMFLEPGYTYRLYFISGEGVKVVTVSIPEEKPEPVSAAAPKGTPKPATGGSPAISAYKRQMAERGEATVDEVKTKLGSKCNPAIETIVARLFTEGAVKAYKSAPDAVAEDLIYSRSKGKTISPKEVEFVLGVDGDFRMLGEPGKKFKSWKELTKADMEDNAYLFKVRLIVNPETGEVIKVAVTFAPRPGEGQPPTSLIGELNNIKRALQGLKLPVDLYMTPDDMK